MGTIGQRNKPLNPSTKYVEEISIFRMESIYIVYGFLSYMFWKYILQWIQEISWLFKRKTNIFPFLVLKE